MILSDCRGACIHFMSGIWRYDFNLQRYSNVLLGLPHGIGTTVLPQVAKSIIIAPSGIIYALAGPCVGGFSWGR